MSPFHSVIFPGAAIHGVAQAENLGEDPGDPIRERGQRRHGDHVDVARGEPAFDLKCWRHSKRQQAASVGPAVAENFDEVSAASSVMQQQKIQPGHDY